MHRTKDLNWNRLLRNFIKWMYSFPRFKGRYYLVKLMKLLFILPKKPIWIKVFDKTEILINPYVDKGVESALFYTGTYEAGTLKFIQDNLLEGQNYIDVGANIGLMTLFTSNIVGKSGKIVSIEPNPETMSILVENVHQNNCQNVIFIKDAIGSEEGEAEIFPNWNINRGGASLINRSNDKTGIKVKVRTLSQILNELLIIPHMIKIDVEGFELEVLNGAVDLLVQIEKPILILEVSKERTTSGGNFEAVYSFLTNLKGYKFYKTKGSKESKNFLIEIKEIIDFPDHDNVYCIPQSAK